MGVSLILKLILAGVVFIIILLLRNKHLIAMIRTHLLHYKIRKEKKK